MPSAPNLPPSRARRSFATALCLLAAMPAFAQPKAAPDCLIKGNISSTGERIYHPPGCRFYAVTVIEPKRGERWFCSEAEAQAAGWRRTKVC
jgi:hypothetical protein